MTRTRTIFQALLILLFLPPLNSGEPSADRTHARALESITAKELREEVEFLASPAMKGRDAGTLENRLTAEYLARFFQQLGLEPAGPDGSYFQTFHLVRSQLGQGNRFSIHRLASRRPLTAQLQRDFCPSRYSSSAQANGSAVFAGYGITAPEHGWDDYRELDVRGKIVLAWEGEPSLEASGNPFQDDGYGQEFHKLLNAQQRGAAGIVLIHPATRQFKLNGRLCWPSDPSMQRYLLQFEKDQIRIPALHASEQLLQELLESVGLDLESARRPSDSGSPLIGRDLPTVRITLSVDIQTELLLARNVVAVLRGSDADLSDEAVILGAHFDHLGSHDGKIFQGADDNASGTAGLVEIAEAMTFDPQRPRRTVLFAGWDAEEKGLLGSRYYVAHPLFPLSGTAAMFQMDMIGRNEEVPGGNDLRFRGLERQKSFENSNALNVLGYSRSDDLRRLVRRSNRRALLQLRFRYDHHPINLLRRSDHWPFLQKGIPSLLFTTGFHPDYHRSGDRPEKLNYRKM